MERYFLILYAVMGVIAYRGLNLKRNAFFAYNGFHKHSDCRCAGETEIVADGIEILLESCYKGAKFTGNCCQSVQKQVVSGKSHLSQRLEYCSRTLTGI